MKAFITHCGFNSFLEAVGFGVPLLGLPIFGDQLGNLRRAQRHGLAVELKKSAVTPDAIADGLKELLSNAK